MLKDYLDSELLETLAKFEDEGLAVFFDYSGHIDALSIHIALKENATQLIYYQFCFMKKDIKRVVEDLKKILKSKSHYYHIFDELKRFTSHNLEKKPRAKKGYTIIESPYKILTD